jgi:proteasome lid subunit RPN8/RPN11
MALSLHIPPDLLERLSRELSRAGRREIGGVLVGEHLGPNSFRIVDLSVQRHGGQAACFVRRPADHKAFLDAFFHRTQEDYGRFNYLGEWHSHPSFSTDPSLTDVRQMVDIVSDGPDAPPFAILLIARLGVHDRVTCGVTAFRSDGGTEIATLVVQARPDGELPPRPPGWLKTLFAPPARNPPVRLI